MLKAPADTLGVVSPLLVSIAGEKANATANDEAASDPKSDAEDESRASSGSNGGAVRADASAPSDERPPVQGQSSAMDVDEPGQAAVESPRQEAAAPSRVHARSDGGANDEFEERPAKAAREEQRKSTKHAPGVNAVLKNVQALDSPRTKQPSCGKSWQALMMSVWKPSMFQKSCIILFRLTAWSLWLKALLWQRWMSKQSCLRCGGWKAWVCSLPFLKVR